MKVSIIVFPGSNCDHDAWYAVTRNLRHEAEFIWHDSDSLRGADAVILPGGFSYGDYLRCGAIARFSPVMRAVRNFADQGGPVLGICNGFQILTEAGLLPGALVRNAGLKFICKTVEAQVGTADTLFTNRAVKGQTLRLPVAHGEGCYIASNAVLDELEANDQVVLRYAQDCNGSMRRIAGIVNQRRNVMGMMPHPERASEPLLGSADGAIILQSLVESGVAASRS